MDLYSNSGIEVDVRYFTEVGARKKIDVILAVQNLNQKCNS